MAIFNRASPYLSIVQLIHFLKKWQYLNMPNLVRQSIHSFKRNSWGVMRKGTFKNFGEQAKGYSFGTRVCGWNGKRLARASLERKASELAISLDRPNKHKSNSTGSQVQQNGFGPALLHSLLRLVKDTAEPNTHC